jgi:hypothetical protein
MAVVRITSFTKNRGAATASIRYITHRPGRDGRVTSRPLYTIDGEVSKLDAYHMIDEAKKGSVFFRIVISPDAKQEDTRQDLYLWQITEQTMLTLEERLNTHVSFTATEHNDHTGNRHVHLLACLKGRIEKRGRLPKRVIPRPSISNRASGYWPRIRVSTFLKFRRK